MNEKLRKLRAQVQEIDQKVEAGEAVQINMSKDEQQAAPINVNTEATRQTRTRDIEILGGGTRGTRGMNVETIDEEAEPENFDLDFTDIELSDEDIQEIIRTASQKSAPAERMPRTRGMDTRAPETGDGLPEVNVSFDVRSGNWYLHEDCVYTTDDGWTITAKEGFEFDLASVPRFLWAIISSFDLSLIGPLYHDLLYRNGGLLPDAQLSPILNPTHRFEREDADDILNELMKKAGVSTWKRLAAYRAVRTFAGYAWKD